MDSDERESVPEWRLSQVFGGDKGVDEEVLEADIVSSVEFDETGDYLAAGDRGGRIVVFERSDGRAGRAEYRFYAEFQSHEAEFDSLKSLEIEEKINQIRFLRKTSNAHLMLTTNDKTVKLWKVCPRCVCPAAAFGPAGREGLKVPLPGMCELSTTAVTKRVFANAHAYHINSIAPLADQMSFVSADDLRINLWDLERNDECFNVVDIKPENMEELAEVITRVDAHPRDSSQFAYALSKGEIRLADLRMSALCENPAAQFLPVEDPSAHSFFSDIVCSISDVKYSRDGNFLVARDYFTLKIWDVRRQDAPLRSFNVQEYLRNKICEVYDNDYIFDRFECGINYNGTQIGTGSYNRQFKVFDVNTGNEVNLVASRIQPKMRRKGIRRGVVKKVPPMEDLDNIDYLRKAMNASFHPTQNVLAIAAYNNLFIFS